MDIKFDKMACERNPLQEYLKANEDLAQLYEDYYGMLKKNKSNITLAFKSTGGQHSRPVDLCKVQELVSLLQQNATLFSLLEYNIRNIPIEDTKAQLNLIIKKLKRLSNHGEQHLVAEFSSQDHLLYFGVLLDVLLVPTSSVTLNNLSKETAVICHLFVKLCHEAGFQSIKLICSDRKSSGSQHVVASKREFYSGTVAVVSEDADVDSAVDTFLTASTKAPWRLRRILVQENTYQQFKDALSWKCKLIKQEGEPQAPIVPCSEALVYKEKLFLIDPMDVPKDQPSVVTVEAYRTRKEMMSLVQKYNTYFLSLWANGIADINEVTFSIPSAIIWVNNLADFRGPPQISEAIYSNICNPENTVAIKKCNKISKLCELKNLWTKLSIENRLDILCGALDKCMLSDPNNEIYVSIKKSLWNYSTATFVDVGKDYVCIGVSEPLGIIGIEYQKDFFTFDIFRGFLYGNVFVVYGASETSQAHSKLNLLEQAGVPVTCVEYVQGDFHILALNNYDHKTKVVWTNSGTIFAN